MTYINVCDGHATLIPPLKTLLGHWHQTIRQNVKIHNTQKMVKKEFNTDNTVQIHFIELDTRQVSVQ